MTHEIAPAAETGVGRFCGTYLYNVDAKGRVVVPYSWRRTLPEIVITRAPERTLLLVDPQRWQRWNEQHGARAIFRTFYVASAYQSAIEGHTGRVQIPHVLRVHGQFGRHETLAVVGFGPYGLVMKESAHTAAMQTNAWPGIGPLELDLGIEQELAIR